MSITDVTDREGFKVAHDISAYSFVAMARAAKPLLQVQHRLHHPNVLQVLQMHYQFQHQQQHHMETQA
jgi:hypothetical protein